MGVVCTEVSSLDMRVAQREQAAELSEQEVEMEHVTPFEGRTRAQPKPRNVQFETSAPEFYPNGSPEQVHHQVFHIYDTWGDYDSSSAPPGSDRPSFSPEQEVDPGSRLYKLNPLRNSIRKLRNLGFGR